MLKKMGARTALRRGSAPRPAEQDKAGLIRLRADFLHKAERRAAVGYTSQLELKQAQAEYQATAALEPAAALAVSQDVLPHDAPDLTWSDACRRREPALPAGLQPRGRKRAATPLCAHRRPPGKAHGEAVGLQRACARDIDSHVARPMNCWRRRRISQTSTACHRAAERDPPLPRNVDGKPGALTGPHVAGLPLLEVCGDPAVRRHDEEELCARADILAEAWRPSPAGRSRR